MDEYDTIAMTGTYPSTIAMTGTYPSTSSFVKVQILSEWHMALCESNENFLDKKRFARQREDMVLSGDR